MFYEHTVVCTFVFCVQFALVFVNRICDGHLAKIVATVGCHPMRTCGQWPAWWPVASESSRHECVCLLAGSMVSSLTCPPGSALTPHHRPPSHPGKARDNMKDGCWQPRPHGYGGSAHQYVCVLTTGEGLAWNVGGVMWHDEDRGAGR